MCLSHTKKLWVVIFLIITLGNPLKFQALGGETINRNGIWSEIGRMAGFLLHKCLPNDFMGHNRLQQKDNSGLILQDCLKRKGLLAIDRALSRDIIEISDGVVLVKWKNDTEVDDSNSRLYLEKQLYDTLPAFCTQYLNSTSLSARITTKSLKEATNWNRDFLKKVVRFFQTRILKINLKGINFNGNLEGRGHKKKSKFGQLMMFGLVAASLIIIPMGFQFLAVLGGKALLLAKLALILTSIQGLKKIATSNVNYGLYSTGHGGSWQYDRQYPYDTESYPYYSAADSSTDHLHHSFAHEYPLHPRVENVHGI